MSRVQCPCVVNGVSANRVRTQARSKKNAGVADKREAQEDVRERKVKLREQPSPSEQVWQTRFKWRPEQAAAQRRKRETP